MTDFQCKTDDILVTAGYSWMSADRTVGAETQDGKNYNFTNQAGTVIAENIQFSNYLTQTEIEEAARMFRALASLNRTTSSSILTQNTLSLETPQIPEEGEEVRTKEAERKPVLTIPINHVKGFKINLEMYFDGTSLISRTAKFPDGSKSTSFVEISPENAEEVIAKSDQILESDCLPLERGGQICYDRFALEDLFYETIDASYKTVYAGVLSANHWTKEEIIAKGNRDLLASKAN